MAIRNYECMFLVDSGRYAQDPQGTEKAIREILDRCEATLVGMTPWQEGKLAYEIEGHRKGLHLLAFLTMDGSRVTEFNRACKLSEIVIRQLLLEHSDKLFSLLTQQIGSHQLERRDDDEEASSNDAEPEEAVSAAE
ncbi:MAG: 30S ribosomal protein S6 [Planctomycetaceae bacterium]